MLNKNGCRHAALTVSLYAGMLACSYADTVRVVMSDRTGPSKGEPGCTQIVQNASLVNDRVVYGLSYEAVAGKFVCSPDRRVEVTRRPWADYLPPPTVDQMGFTPLGLEPAENWDNLGFFNLFINDIGLTYVAPTWQQADGQVILTWSNGQAVVRQSFSLRPGDDKLLMQLEVDPIPGRKIESLVLRLRTTPRKANAAYGNPATRRNAFMTAKGETIPAGFTLLDKTVESWVAFYNKDLGYGPSGLLFLPEEVAEASVLPVRSISPHRPDEELQVALVLQSKRTVFHFALWSLPKVPNAHFTAYLRAQGGSLQEALARLSRHGDWGVPTSMEEPLHLLPEIRAVTKAEERRGYVLGAAHPMSFVGANFLPEAPIEKLELWGAPGQYQDASFTLYALQQLERVGVSCSDLTGEGGSIVPAGDVELRFVKVWPQRTALWSGGVLEMTPELLVRDDTIPLERLAKALPEPSLYSGPAQTLLSRDTTRQVFLTVHIPIHAAAGAYKGMVRILPRHGTPCDLPIELKVLPIRLVSPDKRYILGIYYCWKPWPAPTNAPLGECISQERYARDLRDIREHGFNAITIFNEPSPASLRCFAPPIVANGFREPLAVMGWKYAYNSKFDDKTDQEHETLVRQLMQTARDLGMPKPAFYGIDEPAGPRVETCKRRGDITRRVELPPWKGTYMVAASGNEMEKLVGCVDYPVISSYFSTRQQMLDLRDAFRKAGATPLYYWQIWAEYPKGSRFNAGYFLYTSGFDGFFPYVYQDPLGPTFFDEVAGSKSLAVSCPTSDGLVCTLQWEAARAGITDLRYLLTFDEALAAAEACRGQAFTAPYRKELAALLEKYSPAKSQYWGRMIYGALNWPEHQDCVPERQFDQDRSRIAQMILELQDDSGAKGANRP